MTDIGIASLADLQPQAADGRRLTARQRLDQVVELAEQADGLGLHHFGVGEHHSADFVVSSPAVVLAAIARRTTQIRLTSSVTTLSVHDPVCVYQDFATVDLLSGGRAEITVGRSAFTEPFALFGVDLASYDSLFQEKLSLLLRLRDTERVTWAGLHRGPGRAPDRARRPVPLGRAGRRTRVLAAPRRGRALPRGRQRNRRPCELSALPRLPAA